jgi:Fic family protein
MITTANNGVKTFEQILSLKQEMDKKILTFGKKAHNASKLLEYLYQKPIVNLSDVVTVLEVSKPTANNLLK